MAACLQEQQNLRDKLIFISAGATNIPRNGLIGCNERRRKDRYFQSHIEEDEKFIPEGIEGRVLYKGHLSESNYQFVGGLRAGTGYSSSAIIDELRTEARFVKITAAGLRESHAHDIFVTEEAPNYPMNVKS